MDFFTMGIHLSGKGLDHFWKGIGVLGSYWYSLPILILIWGQGL